MASATFHPVAYTDIGLWTPGSDSDFDTEYVLFGYEETTFVYASWIRLPSVTIPAGATITEAFLRLTSDSGVDWAGEVCKANCYFNDVDDANTVPTTGSEADALAVGAAIAWNPVPTWVLDGEYDTPELKTILQPIIDKAGWVSGNALMVLVKDNNSDGWAERGTDVVELHVSWTTGGGETYEREISIGIGVETDLDTNMGEISEGASVLSEFGNNFGELDEEVGVNTHLYVSALGDIDDNISINTHFLGFISDIMSEETSVESEFIGEYTGSISEEINVNSIFDVERHIIISDSLFLWDISKWGWLKELTDSLGIAEITEKILGVSAKEWVNFTDTELTNWNGTEFILDNFYTVDISKLIQVYTDLLIDGLNIIDATDSILELIITDFLTCIDTVIDIGVFQHMIEDGMTIEDIAKRFFPETISDSLIIQDNNLIVFLILLQISESFNIIDTSTRLITINQTIADSLDILDIGTVRQLLHELLQDGLNLEVLIKLDDEIWECWSLNTAAFHPSVYSGYGFNSFAIFNDTVYGAKSDGIYELTGEKDDGESFHSGFILPKTNFDNAHNKRFRKAFFGVSGNDLTMKMETDSGWKVFAITDTEMSITRDLKGRSWTISVEDFDEFDMIELLPIILSRK